MKIARMILITGLLLGFTACVTHAEGDAKKAKASKVGGMVTAVSDTSITIKAGKKAGGEEVTVAINESTVIKVNGQKATAADVKVGMRVSVKHDGTTAIAINASDKKKKPAKPETPAKPEKPADAPKE